MKRLILMRHAKSSWDDSDLDDRERPLNARGWRDAPRIGAYMKAKGYCPDRVLCSSSQRTRQSLETLGLDIGNSQISYLDSLYLAGEASIRNLIGFKGGDSDTLLVVGHNPGIGNLASQLTDFESLDDAFAVSRFPTAALAVFGCDAPTWEEAVQGRLTLTDFMTPKMLD